MSRSGSSSDDEIRREIETVLARSSNEQLLSLGAGVSLTGLLMIHPSPEAAVKLVVMQRPVEDLVLLFSTVGLAGRQVLSAVPGISLEDVTARWQQINAMLRQASVPYNKYMESLGNVDRSKILALHKGLDDFIQAQSGEGFSPGEYVTKHPELLLLQCDQLLIARVLTAKQDTTAEDMETLISAVWYMRALLARQRASKGGY